MDHPSWTRHLAVAATIALLFLGRLGCHRSEPSSPWTLTSVRAGPERRTVAAGGLLVARDYQRVHSPFNSSLVWLAPEGVSVKKGDVLARLNVKKQQERLREKEVNRDVARLERDLRKIEMALEGHEVVSKVATLEHDRTVAFIAHDLALHGVDAVRHIELARLVEANDMLIAFLERSVTEIAPYVARGFLSRDEQERQRVRLAGQRILGRVLALERLVVESGTTPDKKAQAARDLAVADLNLAQARARLRDWEVRGKEGFADADEKLAGMEQDVVELTAMMRRGELKASRDGIVGYEMIWTGGSSRSRPMAGSSLWEGMSFMRVSTPGALDVELQVPEASAAWIRGGEAALVEGPVGPPRSARVRTAGAGMGGGMRSKYYFPSPHHLKVKVQLDDASGLWPGMSATGHVVVATNPRVLWLDAAAVTGDAVTMADGQIRPIRTGSVEGGQVVVLDGLAEGDSVRAPVPVAAVPPESPSWRAVESRTFTLTLAEAGTLEPCVSRSIALGEFEGDSVGIREIASDGTMAKTSDVLVQLDTSTMDAKVQERELQLAVAIKEEEVTREKSNAEITQLTKDCEVARMDERAANLEDQMVREGERPRKLADLRHDVELARMDVDLLARKLKLKDALTAKGYVSTEEVKQLRLDLSSRQVSLEVARVRYDLVARGATRLELQKSAANLARLRLARELIEHKLARKKDMLSAQLEKAQLITNRARLTLGRTRSMRDDCTLRSPGSGMVILTESWQSDGERKLRVGDTVQSNQVIMSLADTSRFQVRGIVPEDRKHLVKVGQTARFWLTSESAIKFPATVESVGTVARESASTMSFVDKSSSRRCFDLILKFDSRPPKFKPGLSVRFEVDLHQTPGALVIPVEALHFDQEGPFVWTRGGRKSVTVGEESGGAVQVLSGLVAGEDVHVRP